VFVISKPKGWYTPMKKASDPKDETLRRLRAFLDTEEPVAVDFLVRFWEEQQAAISYADISGMIASWQPSNELFSQWQNEYAALVNRHFAPQWERLMLHAAEERRRQFPALLYDPGVIAAQEYIKQRGAELITLLSNEQRDAIQAMVAQAANYEAMTADRLSRIIRPTIGLTARQSQANLRYWHTMWLAGVESGMSPRAAETRADRLAATYAARQHRYRAMSIARTELATAYNQGAYGATIAAQEQGFLGDVVKRWLTAADERVCPICAPLDETVVNLNSVFRNGSFLPPAHPQCRCAVAFEEITPNLQLSIADGIVTTSEGNIMRNEPTSDFLQSLTEEQKIKYFGGKTKAALFDAGLLAPEDYHKPLKDIDLSGIEIPDRAAMIHSSIGEFNKTGRLSGGAHGHHAIVGLRSRGIEVNILQTAPNGVVFGNIPNHKQKFKHSGGRQTWFPKGWTEHDMMAAGIATSNRGAWVSDRAKEFVYRGVNVHVLYTDGRISSVSPSYDQP